MEIFTNRQKCLLEMIKYNVKKIFCLLYNGSKSDLKVVFMENKNENED